MDILKVSNLCVSYSNFALKDISFTISSGEIVGFVGKNGSGKSTTLNAIMGLNRNSSGDISFKGQKITANNLSLFRQSVGFVSEVNDYYPKVRVKSVLGFLSKIYKNWDTALLNYYLFDFFHIDPNLRMIELSTGTRVKLSLAIALSHHAELLILDEPTTGLDPVMREELINLFHSLVMDKKIAVFFSTHITQDLEKIADRVIYLVDGRVALVGQLKRLCQEFIKITLNSSIPERLLSHGIVNRDTLIIHRENLKESDNKFFKQELAVLPEDILLYLNGGLENVGVN